MGELVFFFDKNQVKDRGTKNECFENNFFEPNWKTKYESIEAPNNEDDGVEPHDTMKIRDLFFVGKKIQSLFESIHFG